MILFSVQPSISRAIDIPTVSYSKACETICLELEDRADVECEKTLNDKSVYITKPPNNTPEDMGELAMNYNNQSRNILDSQYDNLIQSYENNSNNDACITTVEVYDPKINDFYYSEEKQEMMIFEMDEFESPKETIGMWKEKQEMIVKKNNETLERMIIRPCRPRCTYTCSRWSKSDSDALLELQILDSQSSIGSSAILGKNAKNGNLARNIVLFMLFLALAFLLIALSHQYNK